MKTAQLKQLHEEINLDPKVSLAVFHAFAERLEKENEFLETKSEERRIRLGEESTTLARTRDELARALDELTRLRAAKN